MVVGIEVILVHQVRYTGLKGHWPHSQQFPQHICILNDRTKQYFPFSFQQQSNCFSVFSPNLPGNEGRVNNCQVKITI
jgi:hypothetical protein